MTYYIEFWLGADRIAEYDDAEYPRATDVQTNP
jgi:hypothetical protein